LRMIGYEGSERGLTAEQCRMVAALADAVHNIPGLLQSWETVDERLLRGMLAQFDARWGAMASCQLLAAYDAAF
jgi:hypothetical protein